MALVKLQSVTFLNVRMNIEGNPRKISAVREYGMSVPVKVSVTEDTIVKNKSAMRQSTMDDFLM